MDDPSNDVQAMAVKCLAVLLKKIQRPQIGEICDKLCSLILDGQDALRDVYSIGLRCLIADVPEEMGPFLAEKLSSRLLRGITHAKVEEVKRECLDSLTELLRRFGYIVLREHEDMMHAVLKQLEYDKPIIRKRAALCLGALAVVCSDLLLGRLIESLLESIEKTNSNTKERSRRSLSSGSDARTLIQTIGTISRTVGFRLGKFLDRIIPVFLRFCGDPADESLHNDAGNELREHCFPGLESFVLRCPREVSPFIPQILRISIEFMKYDPNYCYEDDDDADNNENEMMIGTNEEEEDGGGYDQGKEEDDQEEDYGDGGVDDDDTSWKVRKVAVKVFSAIVTARSELLFELHQNCAEELISRFKEREENVRLDVFSCYNNLLQVTLLTRMNRNHNTSYSITINSDTDIHRTVTHTDSRYTAALARQRTLQQLVSRKVPMILKAVYGFLSSPTSGDGGRGGGYSVKTKTAVFGLLKTLVLVLQVLSFVPNVSVVIIGFNF